jgi:hypothetical protein
MTVKKWTFDAAVKALCAGSYPLLDATVKVALIASTVPCPYSAWVEGGIYAVGNVIIPSIDNGHRYRCLVAHTAEGDEPEWDTDDNAVIESRWQEYGGALCSLSTWAQVSSHEVANGAGYTTGGAALAGKTADAVTRTVDDLVRYGARFAASSTVWTALTKTFRYAVAYLDGTYGGISKPLLFYVLLDDTPADVVSAGFNLQLNWGNLHYLYK